MRRVIGMDIHRTFGEVVFWEEGKLRHGGRIDMTRTALEGFGKSLLETDEVGSAGLFARLGAFGLSAVIGMQRAPRTQVGIRANFS